MKIDNNLSEVFNMEPIETTYGELIINEPPAKEEKVEADFDKSRKNLYNLLDQGQDALNDAMRVAKESEHPRAYEVVGNLMKQVADINTQLMNLHQQKQKLDTGNKDDSGKTITNNAIFVGSTSELNKLINKMSIGE